MEVDPAGSTRSLCKDSTFRRLSPFPQVLLAITIPERLHREPQLQGLAQALRKCTAISPEHGMYPLPQLDSSKLDQYPVMPLSILQVQLLIELLLQ